MDASTAAAMGALAQIVGALGPWGIGVLVLGLPLVMPFVVIFLSCTTARRHADLLETYRQDTRRILDEYGKSVDAISTYYKNNVLLVEGYERVCRDLHSVVVLNTQTMQRLCDKIDARQAGRSS
jgi:hypothetical protein